MKKSRKKQTLKYKLKKKKLDNQKKNGWIKNKFV